MPNFTVVRTTREYETIFILRPDANEDDRKRVFDRIEKVMTSHDGHVLQHDQWGERKLSYRMKKHARGVYHYYRYLGLNDLVAELERNFRLLDPVLKFLTVKLADDVDREERIADAAKAPEPVVEAETETEVDAKLSDAE